MSEEKMLISKYVMVFRLWAEAYEKNIKEHGFTIGYNHKTYKNLKDFHEDTEKQLKDYWDKDVLVKDIPFEDAVAVLCGKKTIFDLKSFEKILKKKVA